MGSAGEPDRKRRQVSSLSPTAASAKKQHFLPISDDKKLDITVLQYRNQKLIQKLETQRVEYLALESNFLKLKEKHQPYCSTLKVVSRTWEELAHDLESCSISPRKTSFLEDADYKSIDQDGSRSTFHEAFLRRLTETGATESSYPYNFPNRECDTEMAYKKTRSSLSNLVAAIDDLGYLKGELHGGVLKMLSGYGSCKQSIESELLREVKSLRLAFVDVFLLHKPLSKELQSNQDIDAKNQAANRRLRGELQNTFVELEEIHCKLATLKAQRDAAKGAGFPILNLGSKHVGGENIRDKVKDLQDMESALKQLMDQANGQLMEIKRLHEERIQILQKLSGLQTKLKNVSCVSSSQAYLLVRNQIEKLKAEVVEYQVSYEKLQAEKDNLVWKERELNVKTDVVDVLRRSAAIIDSKSTDLRIEIQKQIDERKTFEARLEEAKREPGRKEIIAEFKALVSSFPNEMGSMQGHMRRFKETASDVHSLRADVKSLSGILDRKVIECQFLSSRSKGQIADIRKLRTMVQDLEEGYAGLKLILEMFRRESTDTREIQKARDLEYEAWGCVQSLKSCLDEHSLELRVKTANEAEARSQQRLAAAEAEITDMIHKSEATKREMLGLTDVLKSKNEENEAYLSEIESIGQAYDDMQTQNQHLLQQITERDDYNIKLLLEGVKARQLQDALFMDNRTLEREIHQANLFLNFFDMKAAKIEDQLKVCLDQIQKLVEDKFQSSMTYETTQKRLLDVIGSSKQVRESLDESQSKVNIDRMTLLELQTGLEKERFEKRRKEEELDVMRRKVSLLRAQTERSTIIEKLQQELGEYREILKCNICLDRTKQVVIAKCYHLFCHPCVQKIIETRHRKCPTCSTTFGPNDVKSVYI